VCSSDLGSFKPRSQKMTKLNTVKASIFEGSDESSWQAASRPYKDFVT
jgi:hypothetical protein